MMSALARPILVSLGLLAAGGLLLMQGLEALSLAESSGVRVTPPRRIATGELHEYPDVAVDSDGQAWVTWISAEDGHEQVMLRAYQGTEGLPPLAIGLPDQLQFSPRVLAHERRQWVAWSIHEAPPHTAQSRWQLVARALSEGKPGPLLQFSTDGEEALRPALGLDASHVPWVAWESRVERRFRIMAAPLEPGPTPLPPLEVSLDGELNLRPTLAPAPGGGLLVFWDHYRQGEYHVLGRLVQGKQLGPVMRISDEGGANLGPSAVSDGKRTYVAYASNADGKGGQLVGKTLRVKALEDGVVKELKGGHPPIVLTAPGRLDAIEFPQLELDRDGRLWAFARRGQGWIAFCYQGDRWLAPLDLSETGWGGRGRGLRAAWSTDGFHLVARRLHQISHQLLIPPARSRVSISVVEPPVPPPAAGVAAGVAADAGTGAEAVAEQGRAVPAEAPALPPSDSSLAAGADDKKFSKLAQEGLSRFALPQAEEWNRARGLAPAPALQRTLEALNQRVMSLQSFEPGPRPPRSEGFRVRVPQPNAEGTSRGSAANSGGTSATFVGENLRPLPPAPARYDRAPGPSVVLADGVGAPRPALGAAQASGLRAGPGAPLSPRAPVGLYFGDLHTHSWMSDGAGDPDEIYTRSRDRYLYDFVAVTDHDLENGNRLLPSEWAYLKLLAEFFDQPGRFVTFVAYEWTDASYPRGAGHRNVYFPGAEGPLFNVADQAPDTRTLFELIKAYGAVAAPHHIGWTGTDWENHDPQVQTVVEVVSVHGAFEKPRNQPILPRAEHVGMFVRDGLLRGLKFGLLGGSDGHGFPWHYGVSRREDIWRTGITGLMALGLNRAALHAALLHRNTIATSGPAIGVWFSINGSPAGSELMVDGQIQIDLRVQATAPLTSVVLVRDGEDIRNFPIEGLELDASTVDDPSPGEHFYYVRVVQEDQEVAWASPIWVNLQGRILYGPPDP